MEEVFTKSGSKGGMAHGEPSAAQLISSIDIEHEQRQPLGFEEVDRILGGGLVRGSMLLVGGEPGIGKSTLALQLALRNPSMKTLYVSGEESMQQIKLRAQRLQGSGEGCFVLSETMLENILDAAARIKPQLLIVDSIQTIAAQRIESAAGSISQIRDCAAVLLKYAKESGTSVLIIGHITKDGAIAGPKVLEHIVDVVLQFEGDNQHVYRMLRAVKNRFGSTSELGIFEMTSGGLRQVSNPSEILVASHVQPLSGITIAASVDGVRPFLIETQALVSSAVYGVPQRSTTGFDVRRLNMILAVLEKRAGFRLASKDVFLNIAGGIRVSDPAIDLAIAIAVLSSSLDLPVPYNCCFAAELGLSGEVRPVSRIDARILEAQKLGLERVFVSIYNQKGIKQPAGIEVVYAAKIEEALQQLFGKH